MLRSVKKKQYLGKTALWEVRAPQTLLCNTNACLIIIKKQTWKKNSEWFSWNLKGTGLGSNRGAVLNLVLLFIFVTRNSINFELRASILHSLGTNHFTPGQACLTETCLVVPSLCGKSMMQRNQKTKKFIWGRAKND